MKRIKLFLYFTALGMALFSCGQSKKYDGDSLLNYPDMEKIFADNLIPFQKEPYTYKLLSVENGKKDSLFLKANEVPWKELSEPFLKANIFKKELDNHYTINVLTDTILGKMTMLLKSLDPKAITSQMSITAKTSDNSIMTVYAETRDAGFFITKEYKLLFVNRKSLQVQETIKYPFTSLRKKIQTLTFIN